MSTPVRTVTVTVTDVAPPARPALATFGDSTANSIVVNWLAPASPGAAITAYDVQYRETGTTVWTDARHRGTARTVRLTGLTAGAAYEVQVRATNAEGTGDWSPSSQFTAAANSAPAFGATSYSFTLAENADGSGTPIALGSVSATDADGHAVRYSIVAGDDGDVFAIAISWPERRHHRLHRQRRGLRVIPDPGERLHAHRAGGRRDARGQHRRHRDRRLSPTWTARRPPRRRRPRWM